jgi:DNA processing protein
VREAPSYPDLRVDALALALAPGLGPRSYRERAEGFGSAAHAFRATVPTRDRSRLRDQARRVSADGERCGARLVMFEDPDYPSPLRDLGDPPPFLFILGDLSRLTEPAVAIVGTRRATAYGERVTTALGGALAAAGATIVSGMARGIDAAAHRTALARSGVTVAVLGTGVDVVYPVGHRSLHRAIQQRGVVISEFPCGTRALPGSFPRRNRIIAALARLTLVVEAGAKSGALITADHAADLGRDIAAVPGQVDSPQSAGSNGLIRDGVHAVLTADDVLTLVGLAQASSRRDVAPTLTGDERVVWLALADGATPIDLLTERAELTPRRALAAVTALELGDLIETMPTGELRRRR